MRDQDTPFAKITRTSRWLNFALFGIFPCALVLGGALYWGLNRILEQERARLDLDFSILIGYVHAQEQFLSTLRSQSASLPPEGVSKPIPLRASVMRERFGMQLFEGRNTDAEMAFSIACEDVSDCPASGRRLANLGSYLADFYSSYWASSYYPASTIFLINENDNLSLSVPAVDAPSGYELLSPQNFLAVTDAVWSELRHLQVVRQRLIDQDLPIRSELAGSNRVQWFRTDALPGSMLGLIFAGMPQRVWTSAPGSLSAVYAATQFNLQRINIFEKTMGEPLHRGFWLSHRDEGVLIGQGPRPDVSSDRLRLTPDGIVLRITDPSGVWTGVYQVSYDAFFRDNLWLPIIVGVLFLLSLGGGIIAMRRYNRRVITPALEAQRDIVENEEFSRTLIETAPVALCVLARPTGEVVFGNNLALQWLGAQVGARLDKMPADNLFLRQILNSTSPGTIANFQATDGRPLYVAYAPTKYNNQDVVLCAFSDISARTAIENTLAEAKREADKASEAKSIFLATMSHEIRTPLYGVLGSLELMSLTKLDNEQHQQLERMQSSSAILLQLISDILDITKIETGQLVLESTEFSPRELVQSCTSSYAAMAEQKALLLFCCVDHTVPEWMMGDAARIRQILNNLLSNAIKFSDSGHVIARLKVSQVLADKTLLLLQVVDTGVGIGKAEQTQLFLPFYQINSSSHTVRGTGIGLSICARLAKLMDSEIRVTSELGLGSSFSLELPLQVVPGHSVSTPDLRGISVLVRSPRHELTENICRWLKHWGAQATSAPSPLPVGLPDEVLLDVLCNGVDSDALDWAGHHVMAYPAGKAPSTRTIRVTPSVEHIAAGILSAVRGERSMTPVPNINVQAPLGLSVLVADDNPVNRTTLRDQLEKLGCEVTLSSDGAEALILWGLSSYDVVLTDVNMPRLNGYELARELRAQGATIPIIGVTANAMREEEARCLAAGMTSWLVKPISLSTLHRLLRGSGPSSPPVEALVRPLPSPTQEPVPTVPAKYRTLFLATMGGDVAKMEGAMQAGDLLLLKKTLHRMRGALNVMQMTALATRLTALETILGSDGLNTESLRECEESAQSLRDMLASL